MKLRAYWSALPRFAKIAFFMSITLGAILLVLGIRGDGSKFWDERGFLANITTSLVGALFGIPLAVVVIGWFTASHSSRIASEATATLAYTAWSQFGESVLACTAPEITDSLISESAKITQSYTEIERVVGHAQEQSTWVMSVSEWMLSPDANVTLEEIRERATVALLAVRGATSRLRGAVGYPPDYERDWAVLSARWAFLSSNVRVLRYGSDSAWIPVQFEGVFDHRVRDRESPLADVHYQLQRLESMLDHIDRELRSSNDQIVTVFQSPGATRDFRTTDLEAGAHDAHDRLLEIRTATFDPNARNWILD